MSGSISCNSIKVLTRPVQSADPDEPATTDRQERIPGFDQERFSRLCAVLIGAGGLNGETAEGLVRKGIGCLKLFDHDHVELSNLNRQRFFAKDLGKNKAFALARNLAQEAIRRTLLVGCSLSFQDAVRTGHDVGCDVGVCGVDNNRTRLFAAEHFRRAGIPLIVTGVSNEGGHGYTFVQEPKGACFGCAFPQALEAQRDPCPNTPAIKDILKVVAGITLYALDSLFMARPRPWNYKQIFLDGSVPERCLRIPPRPGCPLCGRALAASNAGKPRLSVGRRLAR